MAHLWVKDESAQWAVLPFDEDAYSLATVPPQPLREGSGNDQIAPGAVLMRAEGAPGWVLIAAAPCDVRVNGEPLVLGIRALKDRDEIRIKGAGAFYFSTESLARVEPFLGSDKGIFCPRCKQQVEEGAAAVKCPGCAVWYHQTENLPCWAYSEVCALCPQPTALDSGYQWTPDGF
jgi:hypothetical protein